MNSITSKCNRLSNLHTAYKTIPKKIQMFTHSNVPVNLEPKKNQNKPTKKIPKQLPKQRGTFGRIAEDIVGVAIGTAIGRAIGNIFENRNSHSKAETSVTADNITDSNSENKESTYNEYEITNRSEDVESNGQNSYYDDDDDDDDNDDDK